MLSCVVVLRISSAAAAPSGEGPDRAKVVVFVLDRATWSAIAKADTPNIDRLMAAGAVANVSCLPARPASRLGAYVSLGAGNRALAPNWPGGAPRPAQADGGLVLREIGDVALANERLQRYYAVDVGALGDRLHEAGLRTAVVARTPTEATECMLIAADSSGRVDHGVVAEAVGHRAPPARTDEGARLWRRRLLDARRNADLIVAHLGDAPLAEDTAGRLRAADSLLGLALPELDERWTVLLISPSPDGATFEHMTPLVIRGPEHRNGLLTSGTTQRTAIVHAIDVAPTILDCLGLQPPPSFNGRRATTTAFDGDRVGRLVREDARATGADHLRRVFLPVFAAYMGAVILLTGLGCSTRGAAAERLLQWAMLLSLGAVGMGTAALVIPVVMLPGPDASPIVGIIVLSAVLVGVASRLRRGLLAPLGLLCCVQAIVLVADAVSGARLQPTSPLGYSMLVGARFYGLGNESVAMLVGAAITAWAAAAHPADRLRGRSLACACAVFLGITVVIGHPGLGANTGGTLAAIAGFGGSCVAFGQRSLGRGTRRAWVPAAAIAALAVAAIGAFVWLDSHRPADEQTHMVRAVRTVLQGGPPALGRIVFRKMASNLRLVAWTPWGLPAIPILLLTAVSALRPNRLVARALATAPGLRPAFLGLAAAAIVAFVFNDSGLPMAGIILSFVICATCYVTALSVRVQGGRSIPRNE